MSTEPRPLPSEDDQVCSVLPASFRNWSARLKSIGLGWRGLHAVSRTHRVSALGPNPDLLLGGRTSASAECRHWSGRAVRWSGCAILLGPGPAAALRASRAAPVKRRPRGIGVGDQKQSPVMRGSIRLRIHHTRHRHQPITSSPGHGARCLRLGDLATIRSHNRLGSSGALFKSGADDWKALRMNKSEPILRPCLYKIAHNARSSRRASWTHHPVCTHDAGTVLRHRLVLGQERLGRSIASARRAAAAKDLKEAGLLKTSSTSPGKVNIKTQVLVAYCQWRTNVSLVFSIRRMLLESSAAVPSNETRIAQAPVAERPVALPPARRWSCKCGSRYSR